MDADEMIRANRTAEARETDQLREQVKSYEADIQALGEQVKSYEADIAALKSLYEEHSRLFDSLRRMNVQTTEGVQDVLKSNIEEVREAARAVTDSVKNIRQTQGADSNRAVMEAFSAGQAQMIDALTGLQDSIAALEKASREAAEAAPQQPADDGQTAEKIIAKMQELIQQSDDFNHKENVRVYRNIQSATDDLLQKQTQVLKEEIQAAAEVRADEPQEGGLIQKITLGLVAVAVILQILSMFHVLG